VSLIASGASSLFQRAVKRYFLDWYFYIVLVALQSHTNGESYHFHQQMIISMNRHHIIGTVIQLLPMLTEPISLVVEMIKMVHATFSSVLMQVTS